MKIFSIFMSLLILVMAVGFCPDENACEGKEKQEVSDNGHNQKDVDDVCSPFCHCARCSFSIMLPSRLTQVSPALLSGMKYPVAATDLTFDLSFSIWQPPRTA